MPAVVTKLGPGAITFGEVASAVEFSCQVTSVTLSSDASADDPVKVLCGEEVPGARTYAFSLAGTVLSDISDAAGIVMFTWDHMGETVPFVFTPSTAAAVAWSGSVIIDPLPIGGDEVGANMTSDFEFACVGTPTWV
jgi:hypothetical protein